MPQPATVRALPCQLDGLGCGFGAPLAGAGCAESALHHGESVLQSESECQLILDKSKLVKLYVSTSEHYLP